MSEDSSTILQKSGIIAEKEAIMFKRVIFLSIFIFLASMNYASFATGDSVAIRARAGTIILTIRPEYASPTVDFEGYCYDSDGNSEKHITCLTYKWDFGDGSAMSDLQNPIHTYSSAGTYKVSLTTKDNINEPIEQTEVIVIITVQDSFRQVLAQTKRELDLSIKGEGFFKIRMPNGELAYTRNGSFLVDRDGNVVTRKGYYLEPFIKIPLDSLELSVNESGKVSVKLPNMRRLKEIGQITLARFPNPDGLQMTNENMFVEMEASGPPLDGRPASPEYGSILQSYIEVAFISH